MEELLHDYFLQILNLSVTGSYVILFVLAARLLLSKAPKIFSCGLWGIVLFRLLVPFSFPSAFSFFGLLRSSAGSMAGIPYNIDLEARPRVDLGITSFSDAVNGSLPAATPAASANPLQITIFIHSVVWMLIAAGLFAYGVFTYLQLKKKTKTAVLVEKNIYRCETIPTPCVIGLLQPKIFLPYGLQPSEQSYILMHEQTHIKRLDHLTRPLAFAALCLHWFNPLVWAAFYLMGRDMEMSCDEYVLKQLGPEIKKDYSRSLLSFASGRSGFSRVISGSPLTFGEESVRTRIKNVLKYRHFPRWVAGILAVVLIFAGIGLLSRPEAKTVFSGKELKAMAGTWAEALKTRDGEPRYNMMSEAMKQKFIEEQKQRTDQWSWNFNIGGSSPWVTDYIITVKPDSAEILYHMTDSTKAEYEKTEILYFGSENGKTVVIDSQELISDWERVNYYAPSAEAAMKTYVKALKESDYVTMLSQTPASKSDPTGQQIWDTIKISDVAIKGKDVRDNKACYSLELTIKDAGHSAFEAGVFPRWLWLEKGKHGWYVIGLMTGGAPEQDWWDSAAEDDLNGTNAAFSGSNTKTAESYAFDQLIYLSPLSSSTFDYAEDRWKDTVFTISKNLFQINTPERDDLTVKQPVYQKEKMTDQMTSDFEAAALNQVSLSEFKEKYRYTIYTKGQQKTGYRIYTLDDQLWLASYADNTADHSEIIMEIIRLK